MAQINGFPFVPHHFNNSCTAQDIPFLVLTNKSQIFRIRCHTAVSDFNPVVTLVDRSSVLIERPFEISYPRGHTEAYLIGHIHTLANHVEG